MTDLDLNRFKIHALLSHLAMVGKDIGHFEVTISDNYFNCVYDTYVYASDMS